MENLNDKLKMVQLSIEHYKKLIETEHQDRTRRTIILTELISLKEKILNKINSENEK